MGEHTDKAKKLECKERNTKSEGWKDQRQVGQEVQSEGHGETKRSG